MKYNVEHTNRVTKVQQVNDNSSRQVVGTNEVQEGQRTGGLELIPTRYANLV